MNCPDHVVGCEGQLQQKNGAFLCTGCAAARAINYASCGTQRPTGAQVRAKTDEPLPDIDSPGLNLPQVAYAAWIGWGVRLDVRIGSRAVTTQEYHRRIMGGQGAIIQGGYRPIRDSNKKGSTTFTGNHAMFDSRKGTLDSLADGRRAGIYKCIPTVTYPDLLLNAFAAALVTGTGSSAHPKKGYVWAAFTVDVVPNYRVNIRPLPGKKTREFASYVVKNNVIVPGQSKKDITKGFSAMSSAPIAIRDTVSGKYKYLVQITDPASSRNNAWVAAGWAKEV